MIWCPLFQICSISCQYIVMIKVGEIKEISKITISLEVCVLWDHELKQLSFQLFFRNLKQRRWFTMVNVLGCFWYIFFNGIYLGCIYWLVAFLLAWEMFIFSLVYVTIEWCGCCLRVWSTMFISSILVFKRLSFHMHIVQNM